MAIFKCKICGGALEIDSAQSVATCEYCGTKQTLPRLDDERRTNLYDRANHFRRNNDFDKAMGIFEQILNEEPTDAEAYWSIVLCRYGIEYVEDPATRRRVPTINRAQFTSIFDDENYKSAIANADGYQREVYEAEANAINELQKNILAISQKEEPFDVFICYKETDANGRRTQDSVLATELYHELTKEGFKVFFSRITLEDKLGIAYEPYIFAALNSAKVMVVLGTKPEHFNAVWVKNEWSRYLALIKNGARKTLIPAYRDMDPYDLPEEFSHLQAQDMSKLGFMQDLTRGVKKITQTNTSKPIAVPAAAETPHEINQNKESFLKRAFLFLEDGDWRSANVYCEKVLDADPENAYAYLAKLMVDLRVKRQDDIATSAKSFEENANYQKALRFGDGEIRNRLLRYTESNKAHQELLKQEKEDQQKARKTKRKANLIFSAKIAVRFLIVGALFFLAWGLKYDLPALFQLFLAAAAFLCAIDAIVFHHVQKKKQKPIDKRTKLVRYIALQLVLIGYTISLILYWALYFTIISLIGWILVSLFTLLCPLIQFKLAPKLTTAKKEKHALIAAISVLCIVVCIIVLWFVFPLRYERNSNGSYSLAYTTFLFSDTLEIPEIHFGNQVQGIGYGAFRNQKRLTSIKLPSSVETIDSYAFDNCKNLKNITIPKSVTEIGYGAFQNCSSLTSITIPSNVTMIGASAFSGCYNINTIYYNATNLSDLDYDNEVFYAVGKNASSLNIVVGKNVEKLPDDLFCPYRSLFKNTIGGYLEEKNASPHITSVVFEEGSVCKEIGDNAFDTCESLTKIVYKGTASEWQKIVRGSYWIDEDAAVTVYCDDDTIKYE